MFTLDIIPEPPRAEVTLDPRHQRSVNEMLSEFREHDTSEDGAADIDDELDEDSRGARVD